MCGLLLVDAVHGALWAQAEYEFDAFDRPLLGCRERRGLRRRRHREDVVGRVPPGRRPAEADLHPQEVGPERRQQRLDAVVAAGSPTAGLDTHAAEGEVGVVVERDHVRRIEAIEAREAADGLSGGVVVRLWLHEQHALAVTTRLAEKRMMCLATD